MNASSWINSVNLGLGKQGNPVLPFLTGVLVQRLKIASLWDCLAPGTCQELLGSLGEMGRGYKKSGSVERIFVICPVLSDYY